MVKKVPSTRGKVAKSRATEEIEKKPLRPSQCRTHLRKELAGGFRKIVAGLVERATAGSYQHVKLVVELLEIRPETKAKGKRKGPGPLTLVLREMERKDAEKQKALFKAN